MNRPRNQARPAHALPLLPSLAERARSLSIAASSASKDAARATAKAVAAGWWDGLVERAGRAVGPLPVPRCPVPLPLVGPEVLREAAAYGYELAALPAPEAAAAIGRLYTHSLPDDHRSAHGVFYTPPALVELLLEQATEAGMNWLAGRALSPACGGGQFMVEAAAWMVAAMDRADPAIVLASVSARLRGWDIDPFAAWLAQVAVEAVLLPQALASGKRLGTVTECRDSLMGSWDGQEGAWDLVMENPAFGKVKDTPEIRGRFARSLFGHPNLYGLFMDLGVRLARSDGGIVAYLTPTSFLGGEYFKALRSTLAAEAPPVSVDLVESRKDVFEDVLQEVALTVCRRGEGSGSPARCSIVHANPDGIRIEDAGTLALPTVPTEPWLVPRGSADVALVAAMQAMPTRLADYGYRVRTGPLVWNRHRARLHDRPGKGRVPVVWAESVTQAGRFALKADKVNHAAFYMHAGSRDPNLVRAPCVLLQRTTAKEQHRRLIGAIMPAAFLSAHGAVSVENHLNMVVAAVPKPAVPLATLAAFLASGPADRVIRCINASVAVSATEIEAMPLPPVADLMAAMSAPDPDSALRRLYGIAA